MDIDALEASRQSIQSVLGVANVKNVLVLGSGWGNIAAAFDTQVEIPYADIPVMGVPGVAGHAGKLLLIKVRESHSLIFQGRRHGYEGLGWEPIALPIYVAKTLNAEHVILTNAAGGINPKFLPGDLMVITDHINHMGQNPLVGPHHEIWGQRFPDQSSVYTSHLRAICKKAAKAEAVSMHEGVYLSTSGPVYETPSEIRAFRMLGADAVGMSTVPEAILASAAGLQVAAISCITNHAAGVSDAPLGHEEVLAATEKAMPGMKAILHHVVTQLST